MTYSFTSMYHRSFSELTDDQKSKVREAIKVFSAHPFPQSLRVHKLSGAKGTPMEDGETAPPVWEMHATGYLIITFQYGKDEVIFRNCGPHDAVLEMP